VPRRMLPIQSGSLDRSIVLPVQVRTPVLRVRFKMMVKSNLSKCAILALYF
jgi:hypothetical protein